MQTFRKVIRGSLKPIAMRFALILGIIACGTLLTTRSAASLAFAARQSDQGRLSPAHLSNPLQADLVRHVTQQRAGSEQLERSLNVDAGGQTNVDPSIDVVKLTARKSTANDRMGWSVDVSTDGRMVVVGAPQKVVGGQQGVAYVYVQPAAGWTAMTEVATLSASDGKNVDQFGWSVAVSGDGRTIVVGAPTSNNGGEARGAVYIYERPINGWRSATETAKLSASDIVDGGVLGYSVDTTQDGSSIIAGAPGPASANTIVGTAYVYVRPGNTWTSTTQTAKLTAQDGVKSDLFGFAAAISRDGHTVVLGAVRHLHHGTTTGGAYVYVQPENGWTNSTETTELVQAQPNGLQRLGNAVAISGDGATIASTLASGPSIYVYTRPSNGWAAATELTEAAALQTSNQSDVVSGSSDWSVAISSDGRYVNNMAAVADLAREHSFPALYTFMRPADGWATTTEQAQIPLSTSSWGGLSIAMSGEGATVVVGAPYNIIDGSPHNAAYVLQAAIAFTSALPPAIAVVNQEYRHVVAAQGLPAPTLRVTAGTLPPGLTFSNGILAGVPTAPGVYSFTIAASNGVLPDASQQIAITVFSKIASTIYLPSVLAPAT